VVVLFVAVTVESWGEDALWPCVLMISLHLGSTYGLGITRAILARQVQLRIVTFWLASAALVMAAATAAYLLRGQLAPLVPPPEEMTAALWTGLFAAVVAVASIRAFSAPPIEPADLIERSESEIPRELFVFSDATADEFSADRSLVRSIMIVENLQRPPWIRRLERIKGRIVKPGSYGIMQMTASHPLSDRESIRLAVGEFLGGTRALETQDRWSAFTRLKPVVARYNSNQTFVDLVETTYCIGRFL